MKSTTPTKIDKRSREYKDNINEGRGIIEAAKDWAKIEPIKLQSHQEQIQVLQETCNRQQDDINELVERITKLETIVG